MVTVLGLLGVLAVLFVTAVLATRADPLLADAPPDRPDVGLPDSPLTPADVEQVRFTMAVRGYRMREVDDVLARLAAELADRDRRIAQLEAGAGTGTDAGRAPASPRSFESPDPQRAPTMEA